MQLFLTLRSPVVALTFVLAAGNFTQKSYSFEELPTVGPVAPEVRDRFKLSEFYAKSVVANSLPILGSAKVPDEALREAYHLITSMTSSRPEILEALAKNNVRVAIMAATENTTDIPEHSDLTPKEYWDQRARGLGATPSRPAVSGSEENLLHQASDRYPSESILIHEFAHAIHEMALNHLEADFDAKLSAAFDNAMKQGLWAKTYAATNHKEYWAEAVQSYFDSNNENDSQHNHVDTRLELAKYDPAVFAIIEEALGQPAWRYEGKLNARLAQAGDNREELMRVWLAIKPERRVGFRFLVENMPDADLTSLKSDFLIEHIDGAYDALESAPWKDSISEEVFLNGVLPYANVNERRDAWRNDFRSRFLSLVADCPTPGLAAARLNQKIFAILNVRYSTERRRADQGPFESIATNKASCTGLSILLIDACRSVGVPARFVGTPLWSDGSGNHSWVEVWDNGDWHFTGAAEPAGDRLNDAWFIGRAATAKIDSPENAIYAVSFRRTPIKFPLVWSRNEQFVFGINVTERYTVRKTELVEGKSQIRIKVVDRATGKRVQKLLQVKSSSGQVLFEGESRDDRFDTNDHAEVIVDQNASIQIVVDGQVEPVECKPSLQQEMVVIDVD